MADGRSPVANYPSPVLILGIETSCDETGCSLVRDGRDVLSNVIASQDALHEEYGGVVPEIASRAHVERMIPVVRRALADGGASLDDVDAIAVGNRPGLIGSLLVGVSCAKALAWSLGTPLIGVDHVAAHLYAGCLENDVPPMPALGLVVSGGHTSLYHCASLIDIRRIGSTIDDAVGEAYDKGATILGLEYPGGPRLDRLAQTGNAHAHDLPISRLDPESLDFSYSGLKTALLYKVRGAPERDPVTNEVGFPRDHTDLSEAARADLAASFQRAAIGAVTLKINRALERRSDCRTLLVGGGVSANSFLRTEVQRLSAERNLELRLPKMRYCLDNAAMIAGYAFHLHSARGADDLSLRAVPTTAC